MVVRPMCARAALQPASPGYGWRVACAAGKHGARCVRHTHATRIESLWRKIAGRPFAFVLAVQDLDRNTAYFRDVLGFRVDWADATDWRIVVRGGVRIMLGHCPDALPPNGHGRSRLFRLSGSRRRERAARRNRAERGHCPAASGRSSVRYARMHRGHAGWPPVRGGPVHCLSHVRVQPFHNIRTFNQRDKAKPMRAAQRCWL